jgi:protein-disulfide isomerase
VTCGSYVRGTEPQIRETYVKTGQVKLVFNPMLEHGDRSLQAHHALECAAEQDHFWQLHDLMFAQQQELLSGSIRGAIKGLAWEAGLDTEQFNACVDAQRYVDLVQRQDEHRRQLGIRRLPTLDVNGHLIIGAQEFEVFQELIDSILSRTEG